MIKNISIDGTSSDADADDVKAISNAVSVPAIYTGVISSADDCVKIGRKKMYA